MCGQAELGCEDVHRANREETQCGIASGQTIDHFIDGAITTSRDNFVKAFLSGPAGHAFSFPRARSSADDGTARQRFHLRPPSLSALAVRGGIENDQRAIHPWQRMALIFSSNMVCVTSSRAKTQPAPLARWRDVARPGGDRFAQRELVCAIARDTSED